MLALILPTFAAAAKAADAVGFQVAEFPSEVKTGEQVEVVISLTGYTAEAATADAIRGLQVDITGIDTSVDITWGALDYEYTDGMWNNQTHSYDGADWDDKGSGYVTVANTGSSATTASFSYNTVRSDITGNFTDGTADNTGAVDVSPGTKKTVSACQKTTQIPSFVI